MLKILGRPVSKGTALGPVVVWKPQVRRAKRKEAEDSEAEKARLKKAVEQAEIQLQMLSRKTEEEMGKSSAAIFEGHLMILKDAEYLEAVRGLDLSAGRDRGEQFLTPP